MNHDTTDGHEAVPFVAIGEEEFGRPLGKTTKCSRCGKRHVIENSEAGRRWSSTTNEWTDGGPGLLQFYKCGEDLVLAGIRGREIK